MSEQVKCPVCGKVGISDYHKDNVECPCCGTDLSIYKMLSDTQANTNNKGRKTTIAVLSAVVVLATIAISITISNTIYNNKAEKTNNAINELTASIQRLSSKLDTATQEIAVLREKLEKTTPFYYIVEKNDSPCRISKKIWGTEGRYKEIEAIIPKPLHPGDTLIIPSNLVNNRTIIK